jgi:hypothetical protein
MKLLLSARGPMTVVVLLAGSWITTPGAEPEATLPGSKALAVEGDLSAKMLDGLHRFAERNIDESVKLRAKHWQRDLSSANAYEKSILPNREWEYVEKAVKHSRKSSGLRRAGFAAEATNGFLPLWKTVPLARRRSLSRWALWRHLTRPASAR